MSARNTSWAWTALALALFFQATAALYGETFREGPTRFVPSQRVPARMEPVVRSDQRFVVWATARNARVLGSRPGRIFEAEQCFPAANALALGEPLIAMGLLGVPAAWLGADPILLYNLVLVLMSLFAALAMFVLVRDWTGLPAAGIVAGLLYAFHPTALGDVVHPYASDTTWTVLALFFGRRVFERGGLLAAAGLAGSVSMQVASSFYPFVGCALVALPVAMWWTWRQPPDPRRTVALLGAASAAALVAFWVFGPYLELREAGVLSARGEQSFQPLSAYLPGRPAFPGLLVAALALAGVALPGRLCLRESVQDARAPLLVGAVLAALVAAGDGGMGVYAGLSSVLPGLDTVRLPRKVAIGVHLAASLLAGLGCAGLLRLLSGRAEELLGIAAAGAAFVYTLIVSPPDDYTSFDVRPRRTAIHFYEKLRTEGNTGPIFQAPIPRNATEFLWLGTDRELLLSSFHGRPTSACVTSHPQRERARLEDLDARLPAAEAIAELSQMGFTTIVFDHPRKPRPSSGREERRARFDRAAQGPDAPLRVLRRTLARTAYSIERWPTFRAAPEG